MKREILAEPLRSSLSLNQRSFVHKPKKESYNVCPRTTDWLRPQLHQLDHQRRVPCPRAHYHDSAHVSHEYSSDFCFQMSFPIAAQPDIVRASQKDEGYKLQLAELCHDAVRRVLGPRRAILCSSETETVAGLLYHVLTTGCGQQSLGEEYCDILQVTGKHSTLLASIKALQGADGSL